MKLLTAILVLCLVASAGAADTGRLIIYMRAGGSAMDLQVNLTGPQNESVKVLPHGWVDIRLPEGYYHGDLADGNGGQPEHQEVQVNAGFVSTMEFLGHAVAKKIRYPQKCTCPDDCEKVWVEERNHTVHHEAETRVITVVDEPAYCMYLQLRGHSEYRMGNGVWKPGTCPIVTAFLINCVIPVCEERWIPGEVIETCYPAVTHEETITDTEAWDELIVDQPAGWIEVCPTSARCSP
jgi:hypothetical protein